MCMHARAYVCAPAWSRAHLCVLPGYIIFARKTLLCFSHVNASDSWFSFSNFWRLFSKLVYDFFVFVLRLRKSLGFDWSLGRFEPPDPPSAARTWNKQSDEWKCAEAVWKSPRPGFNSDSVSALLRGRGRGRGRGFCPLQFGGQLLTLLKIRLTSIKHY